MARGRMINNSICYDKRINNLSDDTSRLAFTWLITYADCEGRVNGDPAIVRSMLFPRRDNFTNADMEGYIREWADAGLIVWYEANSDWYICFPAFDRNQSGLRKDREAPSIIPAPTNSEPMQELLRTNSGLTPEQLPVKLKEKKGMEWNGAGDQTSDFDIMRLLVERLTGYPIPTTTQDIDALSEFVRLGVTEADIRGALAYFSKNGYVARGPDKLLRSVRTEVARRTQAEAAQSNVKKFIPEEHASEVYGG